MKTAHQLAHELLALPDLPIYHFDPSRAGMGDESDPSLADPKVERVNPLDGMSRAQIKEARDEGYTLKPFLTLVSDSSTTVDDEPGARYEKLYNLAMFAGMLSDLQRRELDKIAGELGGARLLSRYEIRKEGDLHWDFSFGMFVALANPLYVGKPVPVGEIWARREKDLPKG